MGSAAWRRRRWAVIRRAGRRCQRCGACGSLDVHHLTYARLGRERPGDLVAVCAPCHGALHGRPDGG
jgi:5-methylcytosine-specific restriction endonuclease McrA